MSQNPRNGRAMSGRGQRPREPPGHGERLKPAHFVHRHAGPPYHAPPSPGAFHPAVTYPPTLRGASGRGGIVGCAPPPPPYPPPYHAQGWGPYGVVPPPPAAAFDVDSMSRGYAYGYSYGPPPPPGPPGMGSTPSTYAAYAQPTPYRSVAPPTGDKASRGEFVSGMRQVGGLKPGRDTRASPPPPPPPVPENPPEGASGVGLPLRPGRPDCKHFLSRGWCSYGRVCKYNHPEVAGAPPPPPPQPQQLRPVMPSQGVVGMVPGPWMQYPMYGWPLPAGAEAGMGMGMYGAGWAGPPSGVMYYAPAAPAQHKKGEKRHQAPPNYSARSSDSAASASSRMMDHESVSEHRGYARRR